MRSRSSTSAVRCTPSAAARRSCATPQSSRRAPSHSLASSGVIEAATQDCPRCGRTVPVNHGYASWCECGWNVTAPARYEPTRGRLAGLYSRIGRRLADRLSEELLRADRLEPRLTPARLTAYLIAGAVYVWALLLLGAAIVLAVIDFPNPWGFALAFIPFSLAFFMRPRFGKPPSEGVLEREEAPALYALADEVAAALETPPPNLIVVDEEFNASWAILGLRRRRVLTLGLPLLSMLAPQERVAVIAHELAHGRNGDSSRGLFVGSAVRALEELYAVFAPEPNLTSEYTEYELGLFDRITNVFMWIVSRPILGLLYLELHLLLQDSQRAEYLADALGAEVGGTAGAVGVHEKLFLEPTFQAAVQRVSRDRDGEAADVFEEAMSTVARVPDRERERRRRVARLDETRLDDTHPPSARRLELLERRGPKEPLVTLSEQRSRAIDDELRPLRTPLQRLLVEEHQDALYARYS